MATKVQLVDSSGGDRVESVKFFIGRMDAASYTHPVVFDESGQALVSPEDLNALQQMNVVRVIS